MTKDQIERAVMAELVAGRPRTGESWIEFAVRIHDAAKEEDAVLASTGAINRCFKHEQTKKGACGHLIRDAIRALKVNS